MVGARTLSTQCHLARQVAPSRRLELPPENCYGHTKKLRYILATLEDLYARNPSAAVLDFGCGNGEAVSRFIIDRLPRTARFVGVDLHCPSIDHANWHFARGNAEFFCAEPEGKVDAIIYADVLEHLDHPAEVLARHARMLKPGGIIVGSIPNGTGPFEIESAVDRHLGISRRIAWFMAKVRGEIVDAPYNIASGHVQFYSKARFLYTLGDAGFVVTDFRNGTLGGGMISERILRMFGEPLMRGLADAGDHLPHWAVSSWLFRCEHDERMHHAAS